MLFHDGCFINVVFVTNNNQMYIQNIFKISHTDVCADWYSVLICRVVVQAGCRGSGVACCLLPGPDLED